MSLITLMNIVRVDSTFYYAKLQFDAGGRSLESLLNTRRRSNVCVPTGWKNSIRSLRRREYKRSIDARRPRVVPRDNPIRFSLTRFRSNYLHDFHFDTVDRSENGRAKIEGLSPSVRIRLVLSLALFEKKKKEKFSSNGILLWLWISQPVAGLSRAGSDPGVKIAAYISTLRCLINDKR